MNSPSSKILIWITASVFYAYQYVLRVMPNILLSDIMQKFDIDAATFGQFSGIYYIGYSLMHLPLGILLDRFGPKKIMSISILLTVTGLLPLVFSDHWIYPMIGRLCIGMGSSAAILGVFKIIRIAFEEEKFSRMLSLSVMIGLIGAIYGGGPVHYMLSNYGYNGVIYIFSGVGVFLSLITYSLIPNAVKVAESSIVSNIKEVLTNPKVIFACISAGLMVGPLEGFADVWGSSYLKTVCGLDSTSAASLPSIIFIGMCFGSPVLNFFAEKAGNYFLSIIVAGLIMFAGFMHLLIGPHISGIFAISFSLVGVCSAYQILAIYKVSTFVRSEIAGLTTAVANMIIMIFGYLIHTIIGNVVHRMGGAAESLALTYGVALIPLALLIGTFGFIVLLLQEKKSLVRKKSLNSL